MNTASKGGIFMRFVALCGVSVALLVSGCSPATGGSSKKDKDGGTSGADSTGATVGVTGGETTGGGTTGATTGETTGGGTTGETTGAETTGGGTTGGTTGGGTTGNETGGGTTGNQTGGGTTGNETGGGTTGNQTGGGTTGGGTGGDVSAPCVNADDCDGNICLPVGDGYCSVSNCAEAGCPDGTTCYDFPDVGTYCLKTCDSTADCSYGLMCDEYNTCWPSADQPDPPNPGGSPVGGACDDDSDCADGNATCYPYLFNGEPTGFVNGYCIIFSCTANSCPAGSKCEQVASDGGTACVSSCEATSDCRADEGYACYQGGICFPGCGSGGATCPTNYQCDAAAQMCLPACTPGACTGGLVCNETSGYCEEPPCTPGSCGSGYLCAETGNCVPDLEGGPGTGPGPGFCAAQLPPKDCVGSKAYCGEIIEFKPYDGPGYTNYLINGETVNNQYRSWARRDMLILVKWASAYVDCMAEGWAGGNGAPIGLGDMSESNGAIPGTAIGKPGHPEGTHVDGYDMDIGYYTNVGNNYLKPICTHKINGQDQYHCVEPPTILDVWRTALFVGALFSSNRTRVIGVDGQAGTLISEALVVLCGTNWLPAAGCVEANQNLACEVDFVPGPNNICWKENGAQWFNFHHHHMHLSLWGIKADKPGLPTEKPCLTANCSVPSANWYLPTEALGHYNVEAPKRIDIKPLVLAD